MKVCVFPDLCLSREVSISSDFAEMLLNSDCNIVDFEGTCKSEDGKRMKIGTKLAIDDSLVAFLKEYKFKCVSLANNHIFDYGVSGYLKTLKQFEKDSIVSIGAGKTVEESRKPYTFKLGNRCIALFAAASSGTNAVIATKKEWVVIRLLIKIYAKCPLV